MGTPGPRREPPSASPAPVRVLHLEDNGLDAELIRSILEADGLVCALLRVDTQAAFRAALEDSGLDLILSDYTLPDYRGLTALREARQRRPEVPFVFVSGTIGEENAIEALREGATDYVLKDRLRRLVPAVRRALEERAARDARAKAEADLRRQGEALAQAEKLAAMGSLLAGVAHELNNPLSVVVGHTELLQRGLEGKAAERAAKIALAAQRCARIVTNFLALARQRPPERKWVSLRTVAEEALELVGYSLRSEGIDVDVQAPGDLPALWADAHQLHQVLLNLITNAQHALRATTRPRRLQIRLRAVEQGALKMEVADNGPGIPAHVRARVFEPFFTTKPPGEGTGLGLSLCRGIVEAHGGTIDFESVPGQGTTFRLELPLPRQVVAGAEEPAELAATEPEPCRALIVDDEHDVAAVLADMLRADGHAVETAAGGGEALDRLREGDYDVILTDVRMPDMDGPTLYVEAERRHPGHERRFVFLTGDVLAAGTLQFLENARVPTLSKPFSADEVRRVVRLALERSGPRAGA